MVMAEVIAPLERTEVVAEIVWKHTCAQPRKYI